MDLWQYELFARPPTDLRDSDCDFPRETAPGRAPMRQGLVLAFWLSLLLESIGPDWLRFATLTPLVIAGAWRLRRAAACQYVNIELRLLCSSLLMLAFVFVQLVSTQLKSIEVSAAAPYLVVLGAAPALYLVVLVAGSAEVVRQFERAARFLAILITALAVCFYIDPPTFFLVLDNINPARGFFGTKSSGQGGEVVNIYFPATLLLVPAGVVSYENGRKKVFLFYVLALFLAPSRFGAAILAAYAVIRSLWPHRQRAPRRGGVAGRAARIAARLVVIILPVTAMIVLTQLGLSDDGTRIRVDHIRSVYDEFFFQPENIFFGFGAGSSFFSMGFQDMTDNIELSQVEIFRKYGAFGFIVLVGYIGAACYTAWRRPEMRPLSVALLCYFLAALSNPVLFTLGSMLLYAAALTQASPARPDPARPRE